LAGVEPSTPGKPFDRSYDLADLPVKPAMLSFMFSERWLAADFQDRDKRMVLDGATLSVRGRPGLHEKIESILKQLKDQKDSKRIRISFDDDGQWRDSLEAALQNKKISFEFSGVALTEAMARVSKNAAVPIFIDPRVIPVAGEQINLRVTDMNLKTA